MIKFITNFLIIFFIFQQLKSQIYLKLNKMELTCFAMKLFIFIGAQWSLLSFINVKVG